MEVLLIAIIGIFCGFFVQTMIGFAGALISLPILLFAMNLPDAVAYISIFYLFSSVFMIAKEWRHIDRKIILKLTLTTVIGLALGVYVLGYGKPVLLKKALGIFVIIYVLYSYLAKQKTSVFSKSGTPFGLLGGFVSGLFSTGGPVYIIYINDTVKDMRVIRATMIGILGLISVLRVPMLGYNQMLNAEHFINSLYIFPFFLLAQFLGKKAYGKLNAGTFKNVLMILLGISGLSLLF
ncbi:TSUP family transporter [Leptobacterium flavescens]|uniref:Probable membrane transporter protein n=1 Tax=Leptobacterium flavescens TaxID=472055 RepID=A0A6P0UJZ4_9FLAO|nr:sulfite exporter TauE/SafE family protein [Leptobacterium flavescens]NER13691.1 TSUP family transporter [Leptobacterium flavescens]